MNYTCLKKQIFHSLNYTLVPIRYQDLLAIKTWRNAQLSILRQSEILTDEKQEYYYQNTLLPSFDNPKPTQILFSFLENSFCIGYGGIVHLDWQSKKGEMSFLLNPLRAAQDALYIKDFTAYLSLIKEVAFQDLQLHRLYTETFDIRPLHVSILEKQGFLFEGRLKDHVLIESKFTDSLIHGCLKNE